MVGQPEPLPLPIRDLPRFSDLSAFLAYLDAAGQLRRIAEPIGVVHEITEIHRRVIAEGGPALLFERPVQPDGTVSPIPLLTNLFGTVERVASGLGVQPDKLPALGRTLAELREPRRRAGWPKPGRRCRWRARRCRCGRAGNAARRCRSWSSAATPSISARCRCSFAGRASPPR